MTPQILFHQLMLNNLAEAPEALAKGCLFAFPRPVSYHHTNLVYGAPCQPPGEPPGGQGHDLHLCNPCIFAGGPAAFRSSPSLL